MSWPSRGVGLFLGSNIFVPVCGVRNGGSNGRGCHIFIGCDSGDNGCCGGSGVICNLSRTGRIRHGLTDRAGRGLVFRGVAMGRLCRRCVITGRRRIEGASFSGSGSVLLERVVPVFKDICLGGLAIMSLRR